MGGLNIDIKTDSAVYNKLDVFCGLPNPSKSIHSEMCLTFLNHFIPMSHFYTPWKCQKTSGFLTFLEGIEMWHWNKMG